MKILVSDIGIKALGNAKRKNLFNELHNLFKGQLAVRPNQLDRTKLKQNLKTYDVRWKKNKVKYKTI